MPLEPGTRIGAYEVIAVIGAGGMGQVYRARDTRLDRDVALKILPPDLATDESRVRRFEQEARAAAALSHPNILAVYDIGRADNIIYVVSELLEGSTLRDALSNPVSPARACAWAAQVALGLSAAHAKQIVHRDIKPENLFLTADGRVKILDFGLARVGAPSSSDSDTVLSPGPNTHAGMVLGTVAYMSPEQARGLAADARSDVFSLGVVLYELLAGRSPFSGPSSVESMHATLTLDPAEFDPVRGVPSALDRIVRRCLEKRPEDRFHSAHDLALALEAVGGSGSRTHASGSTIAAPTDAIPWSSTRTRLSKGLAATLMIAAAAAGAVATYFLVRPAPIEPPTFQRLTFRRGTVQSARFEPGSQNVIYSARWQSEPLAVFSVRPNSPESQIIGQSEALVMAISSNQQAAVLLRPRLQSGSISGTLATMALGGGGVKEVLAGVMAADFTADGRLVAAEFTGDTGKVHFPAGHVIFQSGDMPVGLRVSRGGLIAIISRFDLKVLDAAGTVKTSLAVPNITGIAWRPDREELWYSINEGRGAGSIVALSPDGSRRSVWHGRAMDLQDIASDGGVLAIATERQGGVLVQQDGSDAARDLGWLDASIGLAISPAGDALLLTEAGDSGKGVYMRKLDGSPAVKLGEGWGLAWSPGGDRVLISVAPDKHEIVPVGAGASRSIDHRDVWSIFAWFSPDGRRLLVNGRVNDGPYRFWWMDESGATTEAGPAGIDHWAGQVPLSNDGTLIAGFKSGQSMAKTVQVYPADGGNPTPVMGLDHDEAVIRFSADDRHLLVYNRDRLPARIFQLDYRTGARTLWREFAPADAAGIDGFGMIAMTPSGSVVAYNYVRSLGTVFTVSGLKERRRGVTRTASQSSAAQTPPAAPAAGSRAGRSAAQPHNRSHNRAVPDY